MLSRARLVDLGLALFFAALSLLESVDLTIDDGTRVGSVWGNAVIGALLAGTLLVWRPRPVTAYVVMLVVLAVPTALVPHELFSISGLPPLVLVTWSVARQRSGWPARLSWLPPALLPILSLADSHGFPAFGDLLFRAIFLAGAVVIGRTMRRFDLQATELRQTLAELAREQTVREEAAVEAERIRIAAEMQDAVAHAVSVMVVQVGATRMEGAPESELALLRQAEQTGRRAMIELRTILGLLRDTEPAEELELSPLPGLDSLEALVAGVRETGLDVRLELGGSRAVPETAALTTYRIVQEALTNALKHGGPGLVSVSVTADAARVQVRVSSPLGPSRARLPSGGHGLAGMRERVALFGGTLAAAPHADHYVVEAALELRPVVTP